MMTRTIDVAAHWLYLRFTFCARPHRHSFFIHELVFLWHNFRHYPYKLLRMNLKIDAIFEKVNQWNGFLKGNFATTTTTKIYILSSSKHLPSSSNYYLEREREKKEMFIQAVLLIHSEKRAKCR